jgi:hypothetical protein
MTPLFYWYFSDIPLLVRVKTPILRDTQKIPYGKEGYFFKNQSPLFKDKGGFKIWKY